MADNHISYPSNWIVKNMKEIVKWSSGGTPKATEKAYYDDGTIPWLVIGDLNDNVILKSGKKITELGLNNSTAKMIPKGTLLIAMYGSIGKLGLTGIDCCTNQAIAFAKELNGVTTKFMFYYLSFIKSNLIAMGKGGTQKNISLTVLNSLEVPVPPADEQRYVVTQIEELFSQLDNGIKTLQKTKKQLEVYRQAVLKDAFSAYTEKKHIRELASIVTSGSRGWAKFYNNVGPKFIRIGNLTRDRIDIDFSDTQHVLLPENTEGKRTALQPNDVLVSITADLGSIGFVPADIGEAYVNQHIAMIRFLNPVQGRMMAWYLRSEYGQKDLLKNKRGGGKLGLGLDDIRDTVVPIMSDVTSDLVVEYIENHLSVCDSIETTVNTTLQQANALRQSILKKAFDGKL